MGLLDYDIELAKQAIKKAPGLLGDYFSSVNSKLRDQLGLNNADASYAMRNLDGMAGGDLKQARAENNKQMTQKMVDLGLNFNPAAVGQVVWHGSPHKFSKFDMSKIGTGEGAQAYGHGLYMAENPETAQMYRASVSAERGKAFGLEDGPIKGIATLIAARGDKGEEMARKAYSGQVPDIDAAINAAKDAVRGNSQLYKVDIPDDAVARFLDWDKPLSQQHPDVQMYAGNVFDTLKKSGGLKAKKLGDDPTGAELYAAMKSPFFSKHIGVDKFSGDAPASFLSSNGIPGIRYLDGGSRGTGAGTSNFVLFDDQMPRILEVNGQATGLQPWKPGEYGLLR